MRFIDTTTYEFHELFDSEIQELRNGYSILSHRWGSEEITYRDVLSMDSTVRAKAGFSKLVGACALAKQLGYGLIWIDICCIDKANFTELSESINSMYKITVQKWYAESAICFAYLQDVASPAQDMAFPVDDKTPSAHMEQSEWFQRGWTLQELIAPRNVCFYDANWALLGDKSSLSKALTRKTGIPEDVLKNERPPQACSVAQRMSWAAARTTSRVEDQAYSLIGLFDVNMPMIYGEKERAFLRLQQQIISSSADETIFAWDLGLRHDLKDACSGLIANSPACFAGCGDAISLGHSKGFYIDQFGLNVTVEMDVHGPAIHRAYLQVGRSIPGLRFALFLAKLPDGTRYARVKNHAGVSSVWVDQPRGYEPYSPGTERIIVPLDIAVPPERIYNVLWLRKVDLSGPLSHRIKIPRRRLPPGGRLVMSDNQFKTVLGIIRFHFGNDGAPDGVRCIGLGFDHEYQPVCKIANIDRHSNAWYEEHLRTTQCSLQWLDNTFFGHLYDSSRIGNIVYRHIVKHGMNELEVSISARLVPDVTTRMNVPVKIWAVDITCFSRRIIKEPLWRWRSSRDARAVFAVACIFAIRIGLIIWVKRVTETSKGR
ncbi:HET protein [Apiospora marii]|uniref:HET protein n=1 Tax=Apiospora marii TaxID=335849 RepID=UPI0031324D55